jgi:hypothetical protein
MCRCNLSVSNVSPRDIIEINNALVIGTSSDGLTLNFYAFGTNYAATKMSIRRWFHVAVVAKSISSTTMTISGYVNGNLAVRGNVAVGLYTYSGITLCNSARSSYNNMLNGYVSDVRVWTKALSNSNVMREMKSPIPNKSGLFVWAPIENNKLGSYSSDIVYDISGNGHNFVYYNSGGGG